MAKSLTRAAKEEKLRRKLAAASRPDLLSTSFPQQRAFIEDPARFKAAFCTRRAAKSFSAGLYLFKEALENPGVSVLYVALTRDSAKKIMWKDVLKPINREFALQSVFNETNLTATLPNGSVVYLLGCDSTEEEKQKLLGQKYKLCVIDESASFTIDLRELVYKIMKPACADLRGTICCLGTPGDFIQGLFFDVTTGKEPGWTVHTWSAFDNPYIAAQWQAEIDELKAMNPLVTETSWFKQMYLGLWVIDDSKLVYRFDSVRNTCDRLPDIDGYHYVLGVDLGFEDATAFVVLAYHDTLPSLYVVHVETHEGMDLTDVSRKVHELDGRFDFEWKVVDGANKQGVAEMNNRHGTNMGAADKREKFEHQQLMNADLTMGLIKLLPAAAALATEWTTLIKDPKDSRKEHPGCANHAADAALYGWRRAYNYLSRPSPALPRPGTAAAVQRELDMYEARLELAAERRRQPDPWDQAFGELQ